MISSRASSRYLLLATLGLTMSIMSTSCLDAVDGPQIVSVNISPNNVQKSATGMTDEFFTVTITTSGFDSALTGATVAIQELDPPLEAQPGASDINGDVITLQQIPKSWFGGLEEGTYNIETTVNSELNELKQSNTATVTVTAN